MEKQPSGAIEWAFKDYFRTPPSNGDSKWFPEEWQIIQLLSEWRMQQRKREYEPIDFSDPHLATQEQIDECKAAIKKFLGTIEIRSTNTFRPLQLRRKAK